MTDVMSIDEGQDAFENNRARGQISFTVAAKDGLTRRKAVHEAGSLRIRFPNCGPDECETVLVNTAGGIAGGDRYAVDVTAGEGARLVVSGAAAEKIYRTHGPDAQIATRLRIEKNASLRWLPQETILFDRARLCRSIEVDLAAGASLVLAEPVVFGRSAMGETVREGKLVDRWRVRREGRLIYADTLQLDGAIAQTLARTASAAGAAAVATLLVAPGDDALAGRVRDLAPRFAGEVGVSSWNGIMLVRFCAREGAAMRGDLIAVLCALGQGPLPRLWLN
jgi:urease accessory protein